MIRSLDTTGSTTPSAAPPLPTYHWRRRFLHVAAGAAAALPSASRSARAQTYPTRLVRLIVGNPPGGATDIVARQMGQWLSERLGQQFIIENRPGAGTNIGTEVVRAPADGYTFLLVATPNAINATLCSILNGTIRSHPGHRNRSGYR